MTAVENIAPITPFLWFDSNAEEAVEFYLSVFKNSRRISELRSPIDVPTPKGSIVTIDFELNGQQFTALNGGPHHKFSDAISLVVRCKSQEEIDAYWDGLLDGGAEVACGWLHDKFGVAWQIVPENIAELVQHPNAYLAMMQMKKLDIAALEAAAQS